tara:strand:- start:5714 stop:6361 length:648 start_codon:yes stop_codon:yes gene_type:complete
MIPTVHCVRIGNRYGIEHEDYIESKLSGYPINWIREPFNEGISYQWNKMLPMSYKSDKPVCVIDIDILLENDYMELFDYPIERGEFLSIPSWWKDSEGYTLNGGFFKYYPIDCNYIYEKFMSDPEKWKKHYIMNKTTIGPVNGEQYFVEDSVKERLNLRLVPSSWVTRWKNDGDKDWERQLILKYKEVSGNDYIKKEKWHPDIKLIHYTHAMNKP